MSFWRRQFRDWQEHYMKSTYEYTNTKLIMVLINKGNGFG